MPDEDDPLMDVEYTKDLCMDSRKGIAQHLVKEDNKDFQGNLELQVQEYVQQGKDRGLSDCHEIHAADNASGICEV